MVSVFAGGCATIVQGPHQTVSVATEPPGATLLVDGHAAGVTPCAVALARGYDHVLRLALAGHEPAVARVGRTVSAWSWGNVLFLGLPGILVDATTGALYDLAPGGVSVTLSVAKDLPAPAAEAAPGGGDTG